ncbi:glycosyl hydrolase 53 family protein [Paenibacillus sp. 19GGS1-52]|uniref:glycosyl hydrolase 53 family protein n=1 Tax=Paenibacillus sp. 19GGS1-52 TaxID=2758563 RepID=UPI001EFA6A63|nr:glycosyl hydrolase 53 family protein [Paenibacillus sp. 19GGS1-52]ULO08596.1 glycosyl hydrolase 53 family protein [Paenibacillus sp. 19GGS1-52]
MKYKQQTKLRTVLSLLMSAALLLGLWPAQPSAFAAAVGDTVTVSPIPALQDGKRPDFIMGADVSELYALEQSGKKFYDTDGTEMSALEVMQKHGVNYIRLRVWNDPTDKFGNPIGGGNTDLASAIVTAKEAKRLGMGILLDFHYSDFWADPGAQVKPKAWTNHTGTVLQQDVYNFTYQSLQAMKAVNALPDMVQIGNEINPGLLLPDGGGAAKAAPFLQQASKAVRDTDPAIQIMIHMAGNSNGLASSFTGNLTTWTTGATLVDFDIIGISDYPFWHGTMAQNKTILDTLASTYNKKVAVAETSYGWTLDEGDEQLNTFGQSLATAAGYIPTPQGQAAEVRDVINNVANVPNEKGIGVFYWGSDWLPGVDTGWITGQGSGWENQALFDFNGKALPSLDVFNLVRGAATAPAAELTGTDTAFVTAVAGSVLTLPTTVAGQYSDGYYRTATVSVWDTSSVDSTTQGIYTAYGTIGGITGAAKAIITVGPAQPTNLITTNPGFELGTASGWTGVSSPFSVKKSTSDAHSGSYALHFSAATAKTATRTLTGIANGTYTYSIWAEAYGVTSADINIYATGFDSADTTKKVSQSVTLGSWGTWKQYSVTVPVTSGQATIGVSVTGAAGLYGDFDDSYFGLPPVPGDGSTAVQAVTASAPDGSALADSSSVPAGVKYITLSTATPGAKIYYTTDGDTPAYSSGSSETQYYTGPIAVAGNTTIKAYATVPGYIKSEVSTLYFTANYPQASSRVPGGEFDTAGNLEEWTLEGATKGNNEGVFTFDTNNKGTFSGENAFNYYSASAYTFKLSQKVTGLPNGKYTLAAYASGQTNVTTDVYGKYTNTAAIASLQLSGTTPATQKSVNVINQGWNVWQPYKVADLEVTDGTLLIAFEGTGSAGYWGYLDHLTLTKTGDYLSGSISGKIQDNTGQAVAGASVTVSKASGLYGSVVTDVYGSYLLSGVKEGSGYTVTASKAGFISAELQDITTATGSSTDQVNLTLTGTPAVSSIFLNVEETPIALQAGDSYSLIAAVGPVDATIKRVLFNSSDSSIARVTSVTYNELDGTTLATVKAVAAGEATITATSADGGQTAAAHFTITGIDVQQPDTIAPSEVTNASITAGNGYLSVYWQDPADADLAQIKVTVVSDAVYATSMFNKGTQTAYLNSLMNGTLYKLYIQTIDTQGNESAGIELTGTPAAPNIPYVPVVTSETTTPPKLTTVNQSTISAEPKPDGQGLASVTVTADDIKQAGLNATDSVIAIMLKPAEGTQSVLVNIPIQLLKSVAGGTNIETLKIDTGFATLSVSTALLFKADAGSTNLQLIVTKVDPSALTDTQLKLLNGNSVYDFNLSVDGRKLTDFNGSSDVSVEMGYTAKANENPQQVVVYFVSDEGNLEVVKNTKYNAATGRVQFSPKHFSKYAASYAKVSYKDMTHAAWAADSIAALSARGIVQGVGNDSFNPGGSVTRTAFISMLMDAFDLTEAGNTAKFSDVLKDSWYYDAVATAQKLGIVTGRTDGSFGVNEFISRQDMALLVYKTASLLELQTTANTASVKFTDAAVIASYAADAVNKLQTAGFINGAGNGAFEPLAKTSRAEAAVIVYRLYQAQ